MPRTGATFSEFSITELEYASKDLHDQLSRLDAAIAHARNRRQSHLNIRHSKTLERSMQNLTTWAEGVELALEKATGDAEIPRLPESHVDVVTRIHRRVSWSIAGLSLFLAVLGPLVAWSYSMRETASLRREHSLQLNRAQLSKEIAVAATAKKYETQIADIKDEPWPIIYPMSWSILTTMEPDLRAGTIKHWRRATLSRDQTNAFALAEQNLRGRNFNSPQKQLIYAEKMQAILEKKAAENPEFAERYRAVAQRGVTRLMSRNVDMPGKIEEVTGETDSPGNSTEPQARSRGNERSLSSVEGTD